MRYRIEITRRSYKPEYKGEASFGEGDCTPQFTKSVNASSRLDAIKRALPAIRTELPKLQGTFVSVFVGRNDPSEFPQRLRPFQIIIETGELR